MINYPNDRDLVEQASACGIPEPVLVRDIVRLVEVLNLKRKDFFTKRSVLAGSMALRCFDSPRFTVYDADFSTSADAVHPPTSLKGLLAYQDDALEITPASLVPHDDAGTAWKSAPIAYNPVFTSLVPNPADREFKADVSFRGVMLDGFERELVVPYELELWDEPPVVFIMDPHETVAEKTLGWCAHQQLKHYADLAYIALVSRDGEGQLIKLNNAKLRTTLADKLEAMRKLQSNIYEPFPHVDALIDKLEEIPIFPVLQWQRIMYVRQARDRFTQEFLVRAVRELLVPRFR